MGKIRDIRLLIKLANVIETIREIWRKDGMADKKWRTKLGGVLTALAGCVEMFGSSSIIPPDMVDPIRNILIGLAGFFIAIGIGKKMDRLNK